MSDLCPAFDGKHTEKKKKKLCFLSENQAKKTKKGDSFSYRLFYNSFPVLPFLSLLHNSWYFQLDGPSF